MKRDILSVTDMSSDFEDIIDLSIRMKKQRYTVFPEMRNRMLGMIFEKPSTRTRISLQTAMEQMGGHAIYLNPNDMQIGRGETIEDTGRVLSGFLDIISYRAFSHESVASLAKNARVPVINALDDREHPVQMLADFMTVKEIFGRTGGLKITYVGDGNNVANSLALSCAISGSDFTIGCPEGHEPDSKIWQKAQEIGKSTKARLEIEHDPAKAVDGANVVYTDVWVSMGEEKEREAKEKLFSRYQVNESIMEHADRNHIFLHCLPAHRGLEVSAGVIDGIHSAVFQEAENRLHTSKALIFTLLS